MFWSAIRSDFSDLRTCGHDDVNLTYMRRSEDVRTFSISSINVHCSVGQMQPNISEQKIGNIRPFFSVKVNFKENIRNGFQKMQFYRVTLLCEEWPLPPPDLFFQDLEISGKYYTTRHHLITLNFALELELIRKPSSCFFLTVYQKLETGKFYHTFWILAFSRSCHGFTLNRLSICSCFLLETAN